MSTYLQSFLRRILRRRLMFAAIVAAIVAVPISPMIAGASSASSGNFPVVLKYPGGAVTISHRPTRIISLSPTATEDLFAIGAGHQVVAVDSDSNYPKSAPHSSLSAYQPNVEAVARYRPDLVVVVGDEGGLIAALSKIHIPVLVEPAANTIANAYQEIVSLGRATGNRARAQSVIASMRTRLASIVASAPPAARHRTYYVELDQTYYSATSSTFLGGVFSLFGLKDIADRAAGAASGYPQLSSEYIVATNPNLIFLADTICCGQSPQTVRARAGWSSMTAVRKGDIVALNDDIASRWGPRVVVLAEDIRNALVRIYGKS